MGNNNEPSRPNINRVFGSIIVPSMMPGLKDMDEEAYQAQLTIVWTASLMGVTYALNNVKEAKQICASLTADPQMSQALQVYQDLGKIFLDAVKQDM